MHSTGDRNGTRWRLNEAHFRNPVEQCLAGLYVGDYRRAGFSLQHVGSEDDQQLVAPDHPPLAVDRADPVGVPVKRETEVELLVSNQLLKIDKVGFDRRVGVVIWEAAVDLSEERVVLAGQALDEFLENRPGRAVAGIPADAVSLASKPLISAST